MTARALYSRPRADRLAALRDEATRLEEIASAARETLQ
jgi:hypothetical protein